MEYVLPKKKKKKHPLSEELDIDMDSDHPIHEEFTGVKKKIKKIHSDEDEF